MFSLSILRSDKLDARSGVIIRCQVGGRWLELKKKQFRKPPVRHGSRHSIHIIRNHCATTGDRMLYTLPSGTPAGEKRRMW